MVAGADSIDDLDGLRHGGLSCLSGGMRAGRRADKLHRSSARVAVGAEVRIGGRDGFRSRTSIRRWWSTSCAVRSSFRRAHSCRTRRAVPPIGSVRRFADGWGRSTSRPGPGRPRRRRSVRRPRRRPGLPDQYRAGEVGGRWAGTQALPSGRGCCGCRTERDSNGMAQYNRLKQGDASVRPRATTRNLTIRSAATCSPPEPSAPAWACRGAKHIPGVSGWRVQHARTRHRTRLVRPEPQRRLHPAARSGSERLDARTRPRDAGCARGDDAGGRVVRRAGR